MSKTANVGAFVDNTLADDGFVILQGLLPKESVELLRITAAKIGSKGDLYIVGRELLEEHPDILLPVICSPITLELCESVMGPFVQLDSFSAICMRPGSKSGISWHRDVYGSVPRSTAFERPLALNLLIYLQDITSNVGPLRIIRGSHREPLLLDEDARQRMHSREEVFELGSGDGILIHNNLIHSRSSNNSDIDRLHLSIVYTLSFMRPSINTERDPLYTLKQEAKRAGDIRLTRLLGEDTTMNTRVNTGFLRDEKSVWREWIEADRPT